MIFNVKAHDVNESNVVLLLATKRKKEKKYNNFVSSENKTQERKEKIIYQTVRSDNLSQNAIQ